MNKRVSFLVFCIFFVLITAFLIFVSVMSGSTIFDLNSLTTLSLAVLSFSIWFLYPETSQKDERSKFIRRKVLNSSYFILVILIVVFYLLSTLELLSLDVPELFQLIAALATVGLSISWIVIAKKN